MALSAMALRLPVPRLLPRLALPARAVAARRPARNFSGWGLAFTVAGRRSMQSMRCSTWGG